MKFKISTLFLIFYQLNIFAQDLFNYENTVNYASYLLQSGNFKQAAIEYDRAYFIKADDEVFSKLLYCLRKTGLYDQAVIKAELIFSNRVNQIPDQLANEYYKNILFSNKKIDLKKIVNNNKNIDNKINNNYLIINDLLHTNWLEANKKLTTLDSNYLPNSIEYKSIINEGLNIKNKSTAVSASLSAIVPGLGKAYSGNWKDGLISLFLTGASSYQSYRWFKKAGNKAPMGYVFAGISAGFYLGNIVGTVKESKKRKRLKNESILAKVRDLIDTN